MRLPAGDCCVASAFVSYLGPFNKEFRDLLIKRDFFSDCMDNDVPVTPNMNLTSFLVDDSTVGEWNLQVWPTPSCRLPVTKQLRVGEAQQSLVASSNEMACLQKVPIHTEAWCRACLQTICQSRTVSW